MTAIHPIDIESRNDRLDLAIGGMTCASCASRIEKRLPSREYISVVANEL